MKKSIQTIIDLVDEFKAAQDDVRSIKHEASDHINSVLEGQLNHEEYDAVLDAVYELDGYIEGGKFYYN